MSYYAIEFNAAGNGIGVHFYQEEPAEYPANELPCTEAQAQTPMLWHNVNGVLTESLSAAQTAQIALVTQGYNTATDYVPVTINGTTYQVDNTAGKQALNLSLAITANAMLQAPAWVADTGYSAGAYCSVGGVILFCSTTGKSGTSAPTPPTTFGTPVTDGTAEWELLGRKVYLQGGSFVYMTPQQIMSAFQQGELYLHQMSAQLESVKAEINAATTVSAVQTFTF